MTNRLARQLVDAALEFQRRRPWAEVPEDAPFLLRLPDEERPLAGTVIGQAGDDFGLVLMRGERAFTHFAAMILEGGERPRGHEEWDFLNVTFDVLGNVPAELRRPLVEAGCSARREQPVPVFLVKRPHRQGRAPNRGEMRLLLASLRAMLAALEAGLGVWTLDPERREVVELAAQGEGKRLVIARRLVPWPEGIVVPSTVLDLGPDLEDLPWREVHWFAALLSLPGSLRGDDRSLRLFALFELESERLLAHEVTRGEELWPAAEALAATLRGFRDAARGRPRAIHFGSVELADAFAPALAGLGIESAVGTTPAVVQDLQQHILATAAARLEHERAGALPEDLDGWRSADRRLTQRLLDASDRTPKQRALMRFFGSEPAAAQVFVELERLSPFASFFEWFLFDYRSTKGARTFVESFADAEELTTVEQHLLDARKAALLSIYRVAALHRGVALELVDVFTGARLTVHDRALSDSAEENLFLALRLVRVGDWNLALLAGPPLTAVTVGEALALFARHGAPAEGQSLRPHAALFGKVWTMLLARREAPPRLENTDGDPLEFVTATFRVRDPATLQRALAQRDDVDVDADSSWTWVREKPPVHGLGETTLLARLALEGSRLSVEVNSKRRLEALRAWLERIPGIDFERSEARAPERPDPSAPRPPRSRGPERLFPPEARAQIEAHMSAHYRRWLDQPIPELGSLTPRKAVLDPQARRRVFQMIQTMPAASIPGGRIEPPREMLLRELGFSEPEATA